MSAKFLQVFADEDPELQKQIGCMTGIFQMFDRQNLLSARRLSAQSHKRLPSGHAHYNRSSAGAEHNARFQSEKNLNKSSYDNQRVSMESSRTSFSSSSCSSFSSLECKRPTQQEHPAILCETPLKPSPKLKPSDSDTRAINCEPCKDVSDAKASRQLLDFREVVKDSIYRDGSALSVKTSSTEETKNHTFKHRDSPRPTQLSKSMDGSYVISIGGKSRMPTDFNESVRVLVKLKEAPWNVSDAGEPPRPSFEAKGSCYNPAPREARRFSYDGRETSRASLDSREHNRPTSKLRELPRLSLDSRQSSMRNSNFESKPNKILEELDRRSVSQVTTATNYHQELANHKSSPSVVAKLMGLEAMPREQSDLANTYSNADPPGANGNNGFMSRSSNVAQRDRIPGSPKNSFKDPIIPQLKKVDSATNSKVAIETAPWRQSERIRVPPKTMFGQRDAHLKQPPESVYSEIEKRLKELEFRQSNKDLRALKQILDAMQAKGLLEKKKGEEGNSEFPGRNDKQTPAGDDHHLKSAAARNRKNTNLSTPRAFESPIVIMRPAKSVNRSGVSASSLIPLQGLPALRKLRTSDPTDKKKSTISNGALKDPTPRASSKDTTNQSAADKGFISRPEERSSQRTRSQVIQASARSQHSPKENNGSPLKTSSSLSPRLQQRKLEAEKKLRPPHPSSESNKPQRPSGNKQPSQSVSPRLRQRRRPTRVHENDEQSSETSDTRNFSHQGDEVSLCSDSNISMTSQLDVEVTSADRSADMNIASFQQGDSSPSARAVNNASSVLKQKKSSRNLNRELPAMKIETVAPEQPSPISVLDASFYRDDMQPSPVNKSPDGFKDDVIRGGSDGSWNQMGAPGTTPPKSSSPINQKKLESIQNLVQKLTELSSSEDGAQATDHIASLCETKNPDHRYVSEILLASGLLLKDLSEGSLGSMPIQLHASGRPINPDLFLVLEQTKCGWLAKPEAVRKTSLQAKPDTQKLHRKLLFDVVNETLIQKVELARQGPSSLRARKLTRTFPSGQRLLRELCSEIDQLQGESSRSNTGEDDSTVTGEDVLRQSGGWTDFGMEVPTVVLEIERWIFKDLIDDVVSGETLSSVTKLPKSSRRRRQLFAK